MVESGPEGSVYTYIMLFSCSIGVCALFSFLETSITALRLYKLKELAKTTNKYQTLLQSLELNQNRVLTTILIANNFANVISATTGTWLSERLFLGLPESIAIPLGILLTTAAILVFGEVVPKNIAKALGERLFPYTLWITNITYYALYPIVTLFLTLSNYTIKKISKHHTAAEDDILTSEKEIRFLIDYINQKGLLEAEKTAMLKSIFELGTTSVKDILVPASSMVSLGSETSIDAALTIFKRYQFSRIPIYKGSNDNIIGMLHVKDLFTLIGQDTTVSIEDILRPIMFVPDSIKVNQLLKEFKEQFMHIAMVLDEHGNIIGLVTLEDVLEEIVGEIQDEYEQNEVKISPLGEHTWLVDAGINLTDLGNYLHIPFISKTAVTLGGFLAEMLQHVPRTGNTLTYEGHTFQVKQASHRKALQIIVNKINEPLDQ